MSPCARAAALAQAVLDEGSAKDFLKGLPKPPPQDSRRRVGEHNFTDYGIEHQQYFPGAGTAFTAWDVVYVGVGDNPSEAAGDALDQAAEEWNVTAIEVPPEFGEAPSASARIRKDAEDEVKGELDREAYESDEDYAAAVDDAVESYLEQNDSELSYYVLLYLREFDPEQDQPEGLAEGTAKAFLKSLRTTPKEWPMFKRWGKREGEPEDDVRTRRAFKLVNKWRAGQTVPTQRRLKHTRFYKYPQGRFAVRLHDTNVIFYDQDGTAHISVGQWKTRSTRDRINAFAPHGWRLEKYRDQWWWHNINWPEAVRHPRWAQMNYRKSAPPLTGPLWIPFTNNDSIKPNGILHTQNGDYDPHNPLGAAPAENLELLLPLPPLQEVEDPKHCATCGGKCCKSYPGMTSPEDWGAPDQEQMRQKLRAALRSGRFDFDSWYGDPRTEHGGDFDVRMIRPAAERRMGAKGEWDRCALLGDKGCALPYGERPKECRGLVPGDAEKGCRGDYSKRQAAIDWMPYQDLLTDLLRVQAWGESLSEGRFLDKLDWIKRVRAKHKAMREVKKRLKGIEDLKKPDKDKNKK